MSDDPVRARMEEVARVFERQSREAHGRAEVARRRAEDEEQTAATYERCAARVRIAIEHNAGIERPMKPQEGR